MIVVEVLSPSTRRVDAALKLAGYFSVQSVEHYLIVDPDEPLVIHHARGDGKVIATRIIREGEVRLDPPGLGLTLKEVYEIPA